jgi:hypothetical protein
VTPPVWLDARRPPASDPSLLDMWPRGRADAIPSRRPPPAWLEATPDAPHSGLVRLHDGVRAGAGARGLVATRAHLGAGPGGESAAAVRAARPALTTSRDRRGARFLTSRPSTLCRTSMARRHAQGGTGCASAQSPRPAARAAASAAASVPSREYRRNHTRSRPARVRSSGSARPAAARPRWSAHSGPGPARRPPRTARTPARR